MAELQVLKFDITDEDAVQSIGEALSEALNKGFAIYNSVGAGNYVVYTLLNLGPLAGGGIRPLPQGFKL